MIDKEPQTKVVIFTNYTNTLEYVIVQTLYLFLPYLIFPYLELLDYLKPSTFDVVSLGFLRHSVRPDHSLPDPPSKVNHKSSKLDIRRYINAEDSITRKICVHFEF